MSDQPQIQRRRNADFWRAMRYLGPHRRIVILSIVCAFVVGLAFTGGLGTMLPIMRVLINGDSLQGWMYRQVAEQRLGARLLDDPMRVQVEQVKPGSPAERAGLRGGEQLLPLMGLGLAPGAEAEAEVLGAPPEELRTLSPSDEQELVTQLKRRLADPGAAEVTVNVRFGEPVTLRLPAPPWHLRLGMRIVERMPSEPVAAIAAVFGVLAAVTLFGNLVRFLQEYLSDEAAILAVNDIRRQLYDHVLHLPMGYFNLRGTSDATSRLVQDTGTLQEGFKMVLGRTIQEPIKAAMIFGLAMLLSWKLTLFIVLFGPLMFLLIRRFGRKMRRASRKALQNAASMLGQLEGTLGGIRVVKAANAERFERRRYARIMQDLVNENLRMARIDAMSTPVLESLTLIVAGAIVLYASYLVLVARTLEPGTFIMVMLCLVGIGESLRKVSKINNALQKSNSAAARIFETFSVPVERTRKSAGFTVQDSGDGAIADHRSQAADPVKLAPIQRDVTFENVTFTYPAGRQPALIDVTLQVRKGECVAIVGRNGSGKTTLLSLLPRFYDPQQGRILIDGMDIRRATLRSLRSQIGIVTQDSVIFPGTIAGNIAYGLPRSSREQIVAAAKRAFAHEFIMEKSDGYDTVVGEMGGQLSGGQRQRLCIARAILRASPIMILDEATSQVDAESEHLIQQAIESLMHERTTFVIAHRFSTILSADRIVVIDRGRIVGQGRHDDLLVTCPTYLQLYERQLFTAPSASAPVVVA
jgi:ATP-binding cassette, subfamily B, bacterial MsbA